MWREWDWLGNRVRLMPDKTAVIEEQSGQKWTFSQINERAGAVAAWLKGRGVAKGDRVALLSPNHIGYFDLLFACGKIGAIFVPLNWRLSNEEIIAIMKDCSPSLLGVHQLFQSRMAEFREWNVPLLWIGDASYDEITGRPTESLPIDEDSHSTDPLLMIYTGGTTGRPKGVVLSHEAILWNGLNTILSWDLTSEDVSLTYLPMFHTGGLNALTFPILMMGGTVILGGQFEAKSAIEAINRYRCTIILFVPTMYHLFIQAKEFEQSKFPSMKVFLSGGAPCPLEIYDAFRKKGLAFKEGYGLSEAGPNNFYIHPEDAQIKQGSVGKPMLFNTVKVMKENGMEAAAHEVGELWIKGKHSFSFYWNNEQETRDTIKDGWILTGDLVKKDEDGYYYIVGRKKDMIITGGENVYPLEIEQWLSAHPNVDEVAVLGLPDPKWGEIVAAFLVLKPNQKVSEQELRTYCQAKFGSYKIPKKFIVVNELPKTHVGKIDKKELKQKQIELIQQSKAGS